MRGKTEERQARNRAAMTFKSYFWIESKMKPSLSPHLVRDEFYSCEKLMCRKPTSTYSVSTVFTHNSLVRPNNGSLRMNKHSQAQARRDRTRRMFAF